MNVYARDFGGRIIIGLNGEPSNLIPPLATDSASHEVSDLIYVSLVKYNKNLKIVPWAAKSFKILDGGKKIRFKLRKNIFWFDGYPLTAEDVYFTYKLMINPKTPTAYGEDFKLVKNFKIISPYEFEVIYPRVYAQALASWGIAILPKHILEKENLLNTKYTRNPMGAGPYYLKEWEPGRRLVLDVNKNYFEGRACLDEVIYRIIPDLGTMFLELKARNLDLMNLTPLQYKYQTITNFWQDNFNKYKYLSFAYTYLGYNLRHPFFRDIRVRQAIAYALNKQEIIQGVLLGLGKSTIGPYKPGTWVYNNKLKDYPYNPKKALVLLKEAGFADKDKDGILEKDGKPFVFTLLTNQGNSLRLKTAIIIQYRLAQIGIKVKIRTVEWATFIHDFIDKGRFDAVILGWSIPQDPDLYDVWHSSKAVPGGLNFIGFKNKEVDELLEQGRQTLDIQKRKKIYDRVQEILHFEQPYCFLYVPMALPIVHKRFRSIKPAPAGISYNFIHWWVPKREQTFFLP
ncbi:MAG: peptide-binding protein [Desulfonauticus sp.]|nr:peptide-binding protein [Desulfonauticus sp.]